MNAARMQTHPHCSEFPQRNSLVLDRLSGHMTARCTRIANSDSGPPDTIPKSMHSPNTKMAFKQRHSGCRRSLNHKCARREAISHQRSCTGFCHHGQTCTVRGKISVTDTCQGFKPPLTKQSARSHHRLW